MQLNNELLTGIEAVDEQHRWLVDATNRLHAEISQPAPNRIRSGQILAGLVAYTFKHFTMEEELFKRFGYPENDAHIAQHNLFSDNISALLARHNRGEAVSIETLGMLKHWLVEHIMKTDKAYVPFLKEKGAF
jgi:hemerythrin